MPFPSDPTNHKLLFFFNKAYSRPFEPKQTISPTPNYIFLNIWKICWCRIDALRKEDSKYENLTLFHMSVCYFAIHHGKHEGRAGGTRNYFRSHLIYNAVKVNLEFIIVVAAIF